LQSASVFYGKATAYLPVIELLRGYFELESRDDPRKIREKVTGKVLTLTPALGPAVPAFLALLDVPVDEASWQALDPLQRRQQMLDALKRLLLRESEVQPLVVVFEDLHWIDGETQTLLDSLIDSLPAARLVLLVNYRPEYQHAWGGKTYYRQLRIDPLPPESADELLEALLGPDAALGPLKQLLVERTEANPLFLEESVRALVETGALTGERGAHRLTRPVASLKIPATVQAILAARIDRLGPEAKRLLQAAAVIGKDVPFVLLQTITDESEERLRAGLARLQAAEFLYEAQLFPELEYTFKHALTHEVAYSSLLGDRRRALHAALVTAHERVYADRLPEHVERLAHHATRGELWDKALVYGRQAGTRAAARSAYHEAVAWFEQALAALAQLPECRDTLEQAIDLRCELRNALLPLGEQTGIFNHLCDAEALAERLGDDKRLGRVAGYLCIFFSGVDNHERAIAAGERALALATTSGAFDVQVVAQTYLGLAHHDMGEFQQARNLLEGARALLTGEFCYARFGQLNPPAVASRNRLAGCLAELGDFAEGRGVGEEAVRIAETIAQPYSLASALMFAGVVYRRQGSLHTAIPMLERGLGLCQRINILLFFPLTASSLATAYALAGRVAAALPLLDQVLERIASGNRITCHALVLTELSEALLLVGRVDEARMLVERLLELSRTYAGHGYRAHAYRLLGEIATRSDHCDVDKAAYHYRQASGLAEELGMRPLVAHCHLGLGKLYRRTGTREQAQQHLATATTMYREMDMRFWLEQAEAQV
jgi:tetratricopeptide (TPR) repeat protein